MLLYLISSAFKVHYLCLYIHTHFFEKLLFLREHVNTYLYIYICYLYIYICTYLYIYICFIIYISIFVRLNISLPIYHLSANYNCTLHACMMHAYWSLQTCLNFIVSSRVHCRKYQRCTFIAHLMVNMIWLPSHVKFVHSGQVKIKIRKLYSALIPW